MALNFGKRDIAKVADVLNGEYETADEAAKAAIEAVVDLYESKAKFGVVGQLKYSGDKPYIDVEDQKAAKIMLAPFGTETQALNAASQLSFSSNTGEEFRSMVANIWYGTPAAYYKKRNEERKAKEIAAKSPFEQELARRIQWFAENPGKLVYEPDPHRKIVWDLVNSGEPLATCTHICDIHKPAGLIVTGQA